MKRKSNLIIILPTDDSFNSFQLIARDRKEKNKSHIFEKSHICFASCQQKTHRDSVRRQS